jgi:hypothetical protein
MRPDQFLEVISALFTEPFLDDGLNFIIGITDFDKAVYRFFDSDNSAVPSSSDGNESK